MILRLLGGVVFLSFVIGCATSREPTTMNYLQIRVAQLERKVEERDQEIDELQYTIKELSEEVARFKPRGSGSSGGSAGLDTSSGKSSGSHDERIIRVSASPQEVQTALKNAGYYDGPIDGKVGSMTQKAIAQFQKDHDLKGDGIVGKKTWAEMKNYSEEQNVKQQPLSDAPEIR